MKLEAELALNTFDYAAYFPRSKRLARFGLAIEIELPTLGELAKDWLAKRRPMLKPATARDYELLLKAQFFLHRSLSSESTKFDRATFERSSPNSTRSATARDKGSSDHVGSTWLVTDSTQC